MLEQIETPTATGSDTFREQQQIIKTRYEALDGRIKAKRARDIAKALDISEAQWVAASCGPIKSTQLKGTAQQIFQNINQLGPVMALTRNDSCVHERHGQYLDIQANGPIGLVLGPDIDLRIFFSHWREVFAVEENGRHSVQFFDKEGQAVHKVYCTQETDLAHYRKLVQANARETLWPQFEAIAKRVPPAEPNDPEGFRQAWLALTDTHDFFAMLSKFQVSRLGALAHAGEDLAQPVSRAAVKTVLESASASGLPIMCFVGNRGMIQIHTGPVNNIVMRGPWLNVLDPAFNLHLNMDDVHGVWVVNKPTADGWVTSLEVFDKFGELIVQFFGARKPSMAELPQWRLLMKSLCTEPLLD